ncbi:Probable metabolite transport protein GIT1 [Galdieria sulphuraria]|nr:Probable metabolite transport protein GIT1 [Galdieria sulphuraria]
MFTRDQAKRGRKYDGLDLYIFFKHFWARCIGTVIMWFLIDWINYSGGTFGNLVLQKVIGASLFKTVWITLAEGVAWAVWMPFLVSFIVDRLGRRKTEIFGWMWLASTTLITAGFFWQLRAQPVAYIIWSTFQGGFQYFVFVPVYLVPAEAYPTRIRATMYGVSSSLGKMGGIVGTTIFPQIWKRFGGGSESLDGLRGTMWFNAGLSYVGLVICIFFVPEYSQRSLVGEDDRYNELRRRYAGKYVQHLKLNDHEIESEDAESCGIFRLMKYYIFGPKEVYVSYQRKYAAMLAQRSGISCVEEAQEAACLPTYYNDLTFFLKIYWRIRYGNRRKWLQDLQPRILYIKKNISVPLL